ncbi:MAG: TrkA family potassium uptake protein [Armatimonadota bacterium]|nr:TrkA family potassium uptake protein [Armatimonadota bacterium]MDR5703617.1 TrkA family potassium uptake protein [Armatimonadota bacterium]MDR7436042.1 TrkA family potassium uptake protein [Armatimonadota bacterium]
MYVIIVGGGKVGYYLTKALLDAGHEVVLIEKNPKRFELLEEAFGEVAVLGDGCDVRTMLSVGVKRADVVTAVTGDDEDNLVICQLARQRFSVPRVIARINNPKNEEIFRLLGIHETVSSTRVLYHLIEEEVRVEQLTPLSTLRRGNLTLFEVMIPEKSPAAGKAISELHLPVDTLLLAVLRGEQVLVASGSTVLLSGDTVIALSTPDHVRALQDLLVGGVRP